MNPRTTLASMAVFLALSTAADARFKPGYNGVITCTQSGCSDMAGTGPSVASTLDDSGGYRMASRRGQPRAGRASFQAERATGGGMVTVDTAAGIRITVSADFATDAQSVISAAVQHGIRFKRINCHSHARTHRRLSNHHAGNACDAYPAIPASIVRAAGLRSGCDFHDCNHFDNARNVGGVAFWNGVKHHRPARSQLARVSRADTVEFSPRRRHHGANAGLVGSINAKLARWVRPTGKCASGSEQLATYYNSGRRTASGARFNPNGLTAAHRTLPFGTQLTVTNPRTGQSTTVTIDDRGPFTNAKIDLAQGAARAIGMHTSMYVCITGSSYAEAGR